MLRTLGKGSEAGMQGIRAICSESCGGSRGMDAGLSVLQMLGRGQGQGCKSGQCSGRRALFTLHLPFLPYPPALNTLCLAFLPHPSTLNLPYPPHT